MTSKRAQRADLTSAKLKAISRYLSPTAAFIVYDEEDASLMPQFYANRLAMVAQGRDDAMTDNMLMGLCFARFFDDAGFRNMCLGLMKYDLERFEAEERGVGQLQ